MAELVDLKRSPEEKRSEWGGMEYADKTPDYPYGLRVSLCKEELAKLGNPRLSAGEEVTFTARARVSSVNEDEVQGAIVRSIQMTIEAMDVPQGKGRNAGDVLYGGSDKA